MALLKNLYLDLSLLKKINPLRLLKKKGSKKKNMPASAQNNESFKEFPQISKGLLKESIEEPRFIKDVPESLPSLSGLPKSLKINKPKEPASFSKFSFFGSLLEHINKEEKLLRQDAPNDRLYSHLYTEMHTFWENRSDYLRHELQHSNIEKKLVKKIHELQALELEWQKEQLSFENLRASLAAKEHRVEREINNLKKLFTRAIFSQKVPPQHYFFLENGRVLKSLHELYEEIPRLDDATFRSHVNQHKNDFSKWMREVMSLHELANAISDVDSKSELKKRIESFLI